MKPDYQRYMLSWIPTHSITFRAQLSITMLCSLSQHQIVKKKQIVCNSNTQEVDINYQRRSEIKQKCDWILHLFFCVFVFWHINSASDETFFSDIMNDHRQHPNISETDLNQKRCSVVDECEGHGDVTLQFSWMLYPDLTVVTCMLNICHRTKCLRSLPAFTRNHEKWWKKSYYIWSSVSPQTGPMSPNHIILHWGIGLTKTKRHWCILDLIPIRTMNVTENSLFTMGLLSAHLPATSFDIQSVTWETHLSPWVLWPFNTCHNPVWQRGAWFIGLALRLT